MFRRALLHRLAFMRRNRCSLLLAALCLFILLNPLLSDAPTGSAVLVFWMLANLVLAVWALRSRRLLPWAAAMFVIVAIELALDNLAGGSLARLTFFATTAAYMAVVTIALLVYVLDWHPITTDKVFGAVSAYMLISFSFASLFAFQQIVQPGAFYVDPNTQPDGILNWHDLMYFSFTVLTSTGFGEITPATKMARSLIIIEQVLGVMYVAFLIARLANLYGRKSHE